MGHLDMRQMKTVGRADENFLSCAIVLQDVVAMGEHISIFSVVAWISNFCHVPRSFSLCSR
jgi:hypothetical protein